MNIELKYWFKLIFGVLLFCNMFLGIFTLIAKIMVIWYLVYATSYFILKENIHKSIPEIYQNFKNRKLFK